MLDKKGVTDIILVIGAVVITAILIGLGTARFVVPKIVTEAAYTVLDAQLTVDTIYAAPDDMYHRFRIDYPNGWTQTYVWISDGNKISEGSMCDAGNAKTSGDWSRSSYGFTASGYSDECTTKTWVSEASNMQMIKMTKTYDNEFGTSKMEFKK